MLTRRGFFDFLSKETLAVAAFGIPLVSTSATKIAKRITSCDCCASGHKKDLLVGDFVCLHCATMVCADRYVPFWGHDDKFSWLKLSGIPPTIPSENKKQKEKEISHD